MRTRSTVMDESGSDTNDVRVRGSTLLGLVTENGCNRFEKQVCKTANEEVVSNSQRKIPGKSLIAESYRIVEVRHAL